MTFTGALDKLVEEAVKFLYPGLITWMAPQLVPWAEVQGVLYVLGRMFL